MSECLIRGKRVYLRQPRITDEEEFTALALASRRFHHPWVLPASTNTTFESYIEYSRLSNVRACLVCRIKDNKIVGVCNLSQIFEGNFQNAYLGYWVGKEFAGRGYMTDALQLVLAYAFDTLKLHRIEANIQPGNLASIALVRRAGFRLEGFSPRYLKVLGRWRDHERWAICREDLIQSAKGPRVA